MKTAPATALLADDEPHLAAYLRELLAKAWPALAIVAVARNGVEAAERIAALEPDLAFLDIKMPGLTGLEVAQGIEGQTRVVFVTAYDEFAVAAFEQQALDYVLKPVKAERLARTVERLQRELASVGAGSAGSAAGAAGAASAAGTSGAGADATVREPDDARLAAALRQLIAAPRAAAPLRYVRASQGELTHQVDVADVLFFHADDKYTCVRTAAAEYLIRTTITELAAQLDPDRFVQVHRSTIVNLDHLAGTRRDELSRLHLRVRGHAGELPVSRAYVHLFKAM
ncbi:MAG TPA: LytTR family DNA-binding domain-containing protein [Caldimonas sp.]|nr:LytTR family DNA-binding domain-containing protein [Caldimonas sp.]